MEDHSPSLRLDSILCASVSRSLQASGTGRRAQLERSVTVPRAGPVTCARVKPEALQGADPPMETGDGGASPSPANPSRGRPGGLYQGRLGRGSVTVGVRRGTGVPSPSPDKSGTGTGTGTGVSAPCLREALADLEGPSALGREPPPSGLSKLRAIGRAVPPYRTYQRPPQTRHVGGTAASTSSEPWSRILESHSEA